MGPFDCINEILTEDSADDFPSLRWNVDDFRIQTGLTGILKHPLENERSSEIHSSEPFEMDQQALRFWVLCKQSRESLFDAGGRCEVKNAARCDVQRPPFGPGWYCKSQLSPEVSRHRERDTDHQCVLNMRRQHQRQEESDHGDEELKPGSALEQNEWLESDEVGNAHDYQGSKNRDRQM